MTKSCFSVIFITQNGKLKADGKAPILARITVNGEMCHFSTRLTILPERSLSKDYRTVGKTREEKEINDILGQIKSTLSNRYVEWMSRGEAVTANKLKNSMVSKDDSSKSLIELCDLFISDYEKLTQTRGYGKESLFRYQLTRNRLMEFLKQEYKVSDLPLADINKRFLAKLYLWLCSDKKLANNTATKFIHRCSSIYRVALDNGWVKANPFKTIKLHLDKVDRGYLTQGELNRMIQKEFATKRLELVRDIFVFSCYTGLAYIDVKNLTADNIRTSFDGNLWIMTKRQKTNTTVNVPLMKIPQMILDKYNGKLANGALLPILSNQKMNSWTCQLFLDKRLSNI